MNDSKASGSKTAIRVKTERAAGAGASGKKASEDGEERTHGEKYSRPNAKKRLVSPDDDDEDVAGPPAKKGKAASAKPKPIIEPELAPRPTEDVKKRENIKATGKGKKARTGAGSTLDIVEHVDEVGERPLERVAKPKKRKKEEDNYDDRPRKVVKFSDTGYVFQHCTRPTAHVDDRTTSSLHVSSQKLKENQPDKKREPTAKSGSTGAPEAPRQKLATKPPPSRTKTLKGPPREVLERIKASAARHLRCADTEPDELDCFL